MSNGDFFKQYGPWAVITGGSEGVGPVLADRLAKQGFKLLLVARKPGPLEETAEAVRKKYGTEVRTLSQDLKAPDGAANVVAAVKGCDVGLFIHNAGADNSYKYFLDRTLDEAEGQVMLNALTPMRIVYDFAAGMAARKRGGIILCSSLAGLAGTPGNGVYSAAKAFMNTFAEMLWFELGKQGIDVLGAPYPMVRTPAMVRLGMDFDNALVKPHEPDEIADQLLANIKNGPCLHAGRPDTHARAMKLRSMERADAVRTMAGISASTDGHHTNE
jgi:short-subunit dehydrogenase